MYVLRLLLACLALLGGAAPAAPARAPSAAVSGSGRGSAAVQVRRWGRAPSPRVVAPIPKDLGAVPASPAASRGPRFLWHRALLR
jgi:hypothetical protein